MAKLSGKVPSTSPDVFPLLVPVSTESKADGEVLSGPEIGRAWVRRFTDKHAKRAKKTFSDDDWRTFTRLTDAYEALNDPGLFSRALRTTMLHYREAKYQKEKANLSVDALRVGKHFSDLVGLPPDGAFMHIGGKAVGPRAQEDAKRLFAREADSVFSLAHTVHWQENGLIRTGIYCMNAKVALYGHQFFFQSVGRCRWVHCRGCAVLFFQTDPRSLYHDKKCEDKKHQAVSRKNRRATKLASKRSETSSSAS